MTYLDLIRDADRKIDNGGITLGEYEKMIEPLKREIQPERKKGKWIGYNIEKDGWKRTDGSPVFMMCSECNKIVLNNGSVHWNFCPNCGSYNGG